MPTPLQAAALDYLAAGLHLLALTGKKPNGRVHGENWSYDDSFYGSPQDALEWEAIGEAFSEAKGTTGIAILIPQGLLVADVDTERASELLEALGYEPDEDSIAAATKNGLHIWFCWPGADRNRWLGDGEQPDPNRTLLFKGFGGYVVAPPSAHFNDKGEQDGEYKWGRNPLVQDGRLWMPDILPESISARFELADRMGDVLAHDRQQTASFTLAYEEGVPWFQWKPVWEYRTTGLEKAIEGAADGNQNNVIHWAAMTAREEGVPLEVAMERLLAAAERGHHPRNRARDTIRGAYKRG